MNLVSHVYADGDIMQAWLDHYVRLGITRFDLVLHGPEADNATLLGLRDRYPIVINEMYGGPFINAEKKRRLDRVLGVSSSVPARTRSPRRCSSGSAPTARSTAPTSSRIPSASFLSAPGTSTRSCR